MIGAILRMAEHIGQAKICHEKGLVEEVLIANYFSYRPC
jgi:hypothetical protein